LEKNLDFPCLRTDRQTDKNHT